MTAKENAPASAEETERADRQPGTKGHPHERGASRESPEKQREAELDPEDRRSPSGILGVQHRPGGRSDRKP